MTRIILADDHTILRQGIRAMLVAEADFDVVGEAGTGQQLLDLLPTTPTDVIVLDLTMPELDGFAALPILRAQYPEVRVLVLSMLDHERYVAQALDAGAAGYVLKNASIAEIVYGIRTVAQGRPFLCTEIGLELLRKLTMNTGKPWDGGPDHHPAELSGRELEVLQLIAEGLTNAEIADKLFTSKRTIETHRQNIIEKTQAKNTAALIKFAVNQGLVK
ncbi:response regulator transcription factor [Hymenobacter aquaticus]|uniref:Response regulator transcription factor n=1 Tax=Hymenobacter aquaticus TaxID=1867101 RepID=A0A4Z0PXP2_9BACT|nr:response regulator transcription factor [Hymenobacter aquaticus]TGE21673.1 response regulator transcription factor [Hymenobacter aquaticus]